MKNNHGPGKTTHGPGKTTHGLGKTTHGPARGYSCLLITRSGNHR